MGPSGRFLKQNSVPELALPDLSSNVGPGFATLETEFCFKNRAQENVTQVRLLKKSGVDHGRSSADVDVRLFQEPSSMLSFCEHSAGIYLSPVLTGLYLHSLRYQKAPQ
jgi:hypothetical protein